MITELRIRNLRGLLDTDYVPVRPVTILLGSNSSGKSTFLRSFPLFSQSVSKSLRNAVSWFDDSLVDFGDFSTALSSDASEEKIFFSFRLNDDWCNKNSSRYHPFSTRKYSNILNGAEIEVALSPLSDNKGTFFSMVALRLVNGDIINIEFFEKGHEVSISINGKDLKFKGLTWVNHFQNYFLPNIILSNDNIQSVGINPGTGGFKLLFLESLLSYCGSRFRHYEHLIPIFDLWDEDKEKFLHQLKKFNKVRTLARHIARWSVASKAFLNLYNQILLGRIYLSWDNLSISLGDYFSACDYVAPLRAEAIRYYRNQGLQIGRIDAFGRNLPEFIDSLTDTQKGSYQQYMESILKASVTVKNSSGHQSIVIRSKDRESNIADVGFGYSQILPIVTKLWLIQQRKRFMNLSFYRQPFAMALIEQPELHLHPALQAKLADAFIKVTLNEEAPTKIILETHSPTIVNRIGRRIREGFLKKEDAAVVIFDKRNGEKYAQVRTVFFNDHGQIENWPSGFFQAEDDPF